MKWELRIRNWEYVFAGGGGYLMKDEGQRILCTKHGLAVLKSRKHSILIIHSSLMNIPCELFSNVNEKERWITENGSR